MTHPAAPLPPVAFTLAFRPPVYLFPVIVAEYDNATVHPNGCGGMQTDATPASTIDINSGTFRHNPFEVDHYSFPLSGPPAALAVIGWLMA